MRHVRHSIDDHILTSLDVLSLVAELEDELM